MLPQVKQFIRRLGWRQPSQPEQSAYLGFFAESPEPFFEFDAKRILTLANRAALRLGPSSEIAPGTPVATALGLDVEGPLFAALDRGEQSCRLTLGQVEYQAEIRPTPGGTAVLLRDLAVDRYRDVAWRDAERLLRDSAQGMGIVGKDGRLIETSEEFDAGVGFFLGDLRGKLWIEVFEPDDLDHLHRAYLEMRRQGVSVTEVRTVADHGKWRWLRLTLRARDGEPGFTIYSIDLTPQKRNERELERQVLNTHEAHLLLELKHDEMADLNARLRTLAETDGLTGVLNHRTFQDLMGQWIDLGISFAVVMVDVDHFKSYNDAYGHPGGDELLRQFAGFLQENIRDQDVVARYGGEEFVLLLRNSDHRGAHGFLERLRRNIAEKEWPHRSISASFGFTIFEPGLSQAEALKRADQALYAAKASGRDCVREHVAA